VLAVGDPHSVNLERLQEEVPLGLDEAQHGVHRHVEVTQGGEHHGRLLVESSGELSLVSSVDIDVVVDVAPTIFVTTLQPPPELLGVDDPDAAGGDGQEVDIGAGPGNLAVVEQRGPVADASRQCFGKKSLALGVLAQALGDWGVVHQELDESGEAAEALVEHGFSLLVTRLKLLLCRGAGLATLGLDGRRRFRREFRRLISRGPILLNGRSTLKAGDCLCGLIPVCLRRRG